MQERRLPPRRRCKNVVYIRVPESWNVLRFILDYFLFYRDDAKRLLLKFLPKTKRKVSLQHSRQTSENMEIFPVERVANICILTLTVATATAFNWLAFAVFVYKDGGGLDG